MKESVIKALIKAMSTHIAFGMLKNEQFLGILLPPTTPFGEDLINYVKKLGDDRRKLMDYTSHMNNCLSLAINKKIDLGAFDLTKIKSSILAMNKTYSSVIQVPEAVFVKTLILSTYLEALSNRIEGEEFGFEVEALEKFDEFLCEHIESYSLFLYLNEDDMYVINQSGCRMKFDLNVFVDDYLDNKMIKED